LTDSNYREPIGDRPTLILTMLPLSRWRIRAWSRSCTGSCHSIRPVRVCRFRKYALPQGMQLHAAAFGCDGKCGERPVTLRRNASVQVAVASARAKQVERWARAAYIRCVPAQGSSRAFGPGL
jgi:hypothetical protein